MLWQHIIPYGHDAAYTQPLGVFSFRIMPGCTLLLMLQSSSYRWKDGTVRSEDACLECQPWSKYSNEEGVRVR